MAENVSMSQESADTFIPHENHEVKLKLRKEELDVFKEKMTTGEVNIHKEVFTKEKTITVPVLYEELVIESKGISSKDQTANGQSKTIRIPLSEEHIEIVKHPTRLAEVSIYEQQFQEMEHVQCTLKKEKLKVETHGEVIVNNAMSEEY